MHESTVRRRTRAVMSVIATLAVAVATLGATTPAMAADDSGLNVVKAVIDPQASYAPGDTFEYEIRVSCDSPVSGVCIDAVLTDPLPAPLVFDPAVANPVTVELSPTAPIDIDVDRDAGTFSVAPHQVVGASSGLRGGSEMTITVAVQVPTTTGGEYDGQTITNIATADAENAPEAPGQASIVLDVETTLVPSIEKTVSTGTVPAVPGRVVNWTVEPGNASNQPVDTIVVQDPVAPPADFGGYLDLTGVDITDPAGTASRTVEYWVAGDWTEIAPDPISDAGGIRVTFEGSFDPGVTGEVVVHTVTNDAVEDIPTGTTVPVVNDAQSTVVKNGTESDPVDDDATVNIAASNPDVTIRKEFQDSTLHSGQSTIADIVATNGAQDVQTLTITEPSAGEATFTDQGLSFDGFGDGLAWPIAATSATITYTYSDCATSTETTTTVDTLPEPTADCTVEGFQIVFAAAGDDIRSASYAQLPLEVTALPLDEPVQLASTNHVDTVVENTTGQTGDDADEAPFTIDPLIVDTEVTKNITPAWVWGVPGADANISLTGKVTDDSTVGSDYLIISDPADPTTGDGAEFWDAFQPRAITNTDIPVCTSLTLNYWSEDAGAWMPLPGATDIEGSIVGYSYTIPTEITDIGGIQYVFEPTCQETLDPGFVVITNIAVENTQSVDDATTYTNDVQSQVDNENSVVREPTDVDDDSVEVRPLDGDGPDFVDKQWVQAPVLPGVDADPVRALTGDVRTARLWWSTQGLDITDMTITDVAHPSDAAPDVLPDTVDTVFDAFDLVAIPAITTAKDPLIVGDVISKVELFSESTGTWVDITAAACALGCTGAFGGYTLSDAEASDTLGVRITYSERTAGAGVGSSYDRRPLDLNFRLRDTLRSDPDEYVLGTFHDYGYNTGDPGVVNNTVAAHGVGPGIDSTSRDADTITIVDSPINVDVTKVFDQETLGLPDGDVDEDDYPLISARLVATNQSAAKVASVRIDDPDPAQADPTAFDVLDLHSIDGITAPSPLTLADATVTLTHAGGPVDYPAADALALLPGDLADVTAISVSFAAADGRPVIVSGATGVLDLTWQLRQEKRSGGPVETTGAGGVPILNVAHTFIDSPGRIECPGDGCSTGEDTASDEFTIVEADYEIRTQKQISPSSVAENGSRTYTTTLTGQPLGTARTTLFTLTDTAATFWNTMDYTSSSITVPRPVNQLRMDLLLADDVEFDLTGGVLTTTCAGAAIDADSACWTEGAWFDVTPNATVTFALPGAVDAADIVGVRYLARQVEGGAVVQWERPYNPTLNVRLTTERRDTVRTDDTLEVSTTRPGLSPNPGETDPGVISDTVEAYGEAQFGTTQTFDDAQDAPASTTVTHLPNAIKVTKTRGSTPTLAPTGTINYVLTVENTGQWDMTGFEVVDEIGLVDGQSPVVEPDPAAYSFAVTGPGAPTGNAGFSASLDEDTGILTIVNADPDFVFEAGWKLTINAPLLFRPGLSPDTLVTNAVTATSDRAFETCDSTTTAPTGGRDLYDKPRETNVDDCTADTVVSPRASAPVALKKWVKGVEAGEPGTTDDDLGVVNYGGGTADACANGYYSDPCAPITRPGGIENWRLDAANTGNTNARTVAFVDTLPAVGDEGVLVATPRGSEFAVTLAGGVTADVDALADGATATLRTYYSTDVLSPTCNRNAISVHTDNAAETCDYGWVEFDDSTPESELASARTLKFVVEFVPAAPGDKPGLRPGEVLSLSFDTRTPYVLPAESAVADGSPIAFNSFAAGSRTVQTLTQAERAETATEPQRVAVATATGQLQLSKDVVAPDYAVDIDLPTSYPMLVECTSGGQDVPLMFADGSDASRPSIPADGTVFVYDSTTGPVNLPLFAECTVVEDPVPVGATFSVDPDGEVTAERDFGDDPAVHHPYEGDVESAALTITNTYTAGGFVVEKQVDAGGAVDQDGNDIVYDAAFDFTASCTYGGEEVVGLTDRVFTVAAGAQKVVDGIPTGAECEVVETTTGLAASTSATVTQGGTSVTTPGTTTTFEIVAGAPALTTVAFENVMTVGSIEIEKIVDGNGAADFGAGPFTLHLTCTLSGANPDTVYDGDLVVGGAQSLTARVDDLPTGAACAVTEIDSAGAHRVVITPEDVVIGVDDVVSVEVRNTFLIGGLTVEKRVEGPGAALYGAGPFEVELSCLYLGEPVTIPGGATRVLDAGNGYTATYAALPVDAVCGLTETEDGGATSTEVLDDAGNPFVDVEIVEDVTAQVVLINTFELGSVAVDKQVTGPAAAFHTDDEFEVTLTCEWEGAALVIPGGAARTITAAQGTVYADLPLGAVCGLEETDQGAADEASLVDANGDELGEFTITDGSARIAVTAVNVFETGAFEVLKELDGPGAAFHADDVFEVTASCTFDGEPFDIPGGAVRTVSAATSAVYDALPLGAVCAVEETDAGDADATAVVGADGEPVTQFTVSDADEVLQVTAVNTFEVGSFQVVKELDGDAAAFHAEDVFEVTASCTLHGSPIEIPGGASRSLTVAEAAVFGGLPLGAECAIEETDAGDANATTIVDAAGEETDTVVVGTDGELALTVVNTFEVGSFRVVKTLSGEGAALHEDDVFEVTATCTYRDEPVVVPGGATQSLSVEAPAVYDGLPDGAVCDIEETDAGDAASTTMTPAADATGTTARITVAVDTVAEITVDNAFDAGKSPDDEELTPTGGDGTLVLLVGGAALLLIVAGGILLIARRRES
jgi:hypothetical protein